MKKIFTILGLAAVSLLSAQTNLVQNPGFEDWADPAVRPTGWFGTNSDFTRTTNPVKSGVYSAGLTSRATATGGNATVSAGATDIAVTAGKTYIYSGWYLDNVSNAAIRHWGQWRTDSALISDSSLQTSTNLSEGSAWQQFSVEATAPATATIARLSVRVYNQDGTVGGTIYLDDVSFVDKEDLSVVDVKDFENKVRMNTIVENELKLFLPERSTVNIYSIDGRLVSSNRVSDGESVNTTSLQKGNYIVTVDNGTAKVSRKIIKK
ncbi:MAG: T9SS type A sorting domain-containing protein [Cruoricaptor ignavus]|nr:T9SS type A sorting domain-containing protein [Cruoricaptor ignavus]